MWVHEYKTQKFSLWWGRWRDQRLCLLSHQFSHPWLARFSLSDHKNYIFFVFSNFFSQRPCASMSWTQYTAPPNDSENIIQDKQRRQMLYIFHIQINRRQWPWLLSINLYVEKIYSPVRLHLFIFFNFIRSLGLTIFDFWGRLYSRISFDIF